MNFFSSEDLKCMCDVHSKTPHSKMQLCNKIGFCPPLNGYIWIWYNHTTFPDSGTHYKGEKMYHALEGKQQIEM